MHPFNYQEGKFSESSECSSILGLIIGSGLGLSLSFRV